MQVAERALPSGEIVYYVEHSVVNPTPTEDDGYTPLHLMIECTTKPQAIALAQLMKATNDIYLEVRNEETTGT